MQADDRMPVSTLVLPSAACSWEVSLAIQVVIGQFLVCYPVWVPLTAELAASIFTALFTLQWQKLLTIIYTSVSGATTVMLCVD